MTRRQFLKLAGLSAAAAYLGGRAAWFSRGEKYDLHLTEWEVPLARLPRDLDGLRLVHFSDVHLTPALSEDYQRRALHLAAGLPADAYCYTGDLLSTVPRYLRKRQALLEAFRGKRGQYAVLGNHDYFYGRRPAVVETLGRAGWQVLRNRSLPLPATGGRVWMVGVDDPVTGRDDLAAALEEVPRDAVRLALTHTPDLVAGLQPGQVDLLLAGHTHGGQVVLPLLGPPATNTQLPARYAAGLFNYRGTMLEVTRGVGVVQPYYRLNCPPEIALLTLRRGPLPAVGAEPRPRTRRLISVWEAWRAW